MTIKSRIAKGRIGKDRTAKDRIARGRTAKDRATKGRTAEGGAYKTGRGYALLAAGVVLTPRR